MENQESIIAYKLFRKMKDGNYAPLFINKRQRLIVGVEYQAEAHRTTGYAYRPGWHCCTAPTAPHLSESGRVWCRVQIKGYRVMHRPAHQGGKWFLADSMTIINEL
jgi:hypothetical protein